MENEKQNKIPAWECPKCGTTHPITVESCCKNSGKQENNKPYPPQYPSPYPYIPVSPPIYPWDPWTCKS